MLTKRGCRAETYRLVESGVLRVQPCELCGCAKVDCHHEDYQNPTDIHWLCQKCHTIIHSRWRRNRGRNKGMKLKATWYEIVLAETRRRGRFNGPPPKFDRIKITPTLHRQGRGGGTVKHPDHALESTRHELAQASLFRV